MQAQCGPPRASSREVRSPLGISWGTQNPPLYRTAPAASQAPVKVTHQMFFAISHVGSSHYVKVYQRNILPIENVTKGIFCLLNNSPREYFECSTFHHAHKFLLCNIVPTLGFRKVQLGQAPGCVLCARGVCTFRFRARASFLRSPWLVWGCVYFVFLGSRVISAAALAGVGGLL